MIDVHFNQENVILPFIKRLKKRHITCAHLIPKVGFHINHSKAIEQFGNIFKCTIDDKLWKQLRSDRLFRDYKALINDSINRILISSFNLKGCATSF